MILPGATLGLLGGGQLGRMFTVAARTMGYRVVVLDPDPHSPAAELANAHLCAPYEDPAALAAMARECVAVTTEFENAPAASMDELARHCDVRPAGASVAVAQDRMREKSFMLEHGFAVGPVAFLRGEADVPAALARVKLPGILKTARFGYDGKGQQGIADEQALRAALRAAPDTPLVLEQKLDLACEVSVVLARGADGETSCYPVAENQHRDGILDVTIVPARIDPQLAARATEMAVGIAARLDYHGVLAVEFFVLGDGSLLVNEIAPRPHNSGHYTLDACLTSQFEQQLRVLCGLPLGDARLHTPAVMVNLLGDVWQHGPRWDRLLAHHNVKLHLYGKREPRPGRKMGHFTALGDSVDEALTLARSVRDELVAP